MTVLADPASSNQFASPGATERARARDRWAADVAAAVVGALQSEPITDAVPHHVALLLLLGGYRLALRQLRCGAITRGGALSVEDATALELAIVEAARQ
jgi:hypothetical protein